MTRDAGARILLDGSPTIGDQRCRRSGFFGFCFGDVSRLARKSLLASELHNVVAAGVPSFGDIIRSFCRWPVATVAGNAGRTACASAQNGADFCLVLLVMGHKWN